VEYRIATLRACFYNIYLLAHSQHPTLELAGRRKERPQGSFTDDDLLIGTTDHNRPLYVTGECEGRRLNCILVDSGSSINIMSLKVLQSLMLEAKPLSKEKSDHSWV